MGALPAPPRDPVTLGLEFDTGGGRHEAAEGWSWARPPDAAHGLRQQQVPRPQALGEFKTQSPAPAVSRPVGPTLIPAPGGRGESRRVPHYSFLTSSLFWAA